MSLLSLWFLNRITVFYSKWAAFHFFGSSLCLTSPMKNLSDSYLIKIWILFDLNSFQFRSNFDYFQISFIICLNLDLYLTEIVYFWFIPDSITNLYFFSYCCLSVLSLKNLCGENILTHTIHVFFIKRKKLVSTSQL